jgi:hypothetical protein
LRHRWPALSPHAHDDERDHQPAAEATVAKYMWIGFALVEAIALYGLVIAFIIMGLRK